MKKILLSIAITSIASSTLVQADTFRYKIPQPQLVTNDWDGDGIPNSEDTDDDNDGILDTNDDNPFSGRPNTGSGSSTGPYTYTGDTCEDDGLLEQVTVDELNIWSGNSYTTSSWCSITNLTIFNKDIVEVHEAVGGLTNLTQLHLHYNQITVLPESIWNLKNLTTLNLNNNKLTIISDGIGNLTQLNDLYLYDNQITEISDNVNDITNLISLYLFNNIGSPFNNISCNGIADCRK